MARKPAKERWPAYEVAARSLDELSPHAANARTHDEAQVEEIARSIGQFGWTNPVLVDEAGTVIAGHGRRLAAQKIYAEGGTIRLPDGRELPKGTVPAIDCTGWSDAQKRAYMLADNQIALNAGWDMDLLRTELERLTDEGFDLSLAGFSEDQLAAALSTGRVGLQDPDDAPPVAANAISRKGDLWLCGKHRVLCCDSTKAEDVGRLLAGAKPDAVVTDPPYGVGVEYETFADTQANTASIVERFMPIVLGMNCPIALTPGVPVMWKYPQPSWVMVWVHPAPTGGCAWGFAGVNPILVYGKDPYLRAGKGRRPDHIVIAAGREGVEGHPTPKPIKVWSWLVERMTRGPGKLIFDPFLGSGTTMIAAEMERRYCLGMELSELYVDVIVKRWQDFTGEAATLDGDGRTFDEIAKGRFAEAA